LGLRRRSVRGAIIIVCVQALMLMNLVGEFVGLVAELARGATGGDL
jgi:hypothetical protein